jgi:predicted DNA-binding transcriptional regulator AlpA
MPRESQPGTVAPGANGTAPPAAGGDTPAPTDAVAALREHPAAGRPASAAAAVAPLLLAAGQAAAVCAVSVASWHRMVSAGRCPAPLRLSPGCVRWRAEELRDWIAAGCPPRQGWEALRAAQRDGRRG